MPSQVEWANRALDKLGEQPLIALTDNTKAGRTVNRMFSIVQDAEMRARKWSFTIKRAMLAADVATPVYGYGSQFQLPDDCLRVLSIFQWDIGPDITDYRVGGNQIYVIEGRKILYGTAIPGGPPSTSPMPLRYISRVDDTTLWDPTFGEAFACRLAAECAEAITQSSQKKQFAWQEYTQAVNVAKRANAIELPADSIGDGAWTWERLRG